PPALPCASVGADLSKSRVSGVDTTLSRPPCRCRPAGRRWHARLWLRTPPQSPEPGLPPRRSRAFITMSFHGWRDRCGTVQFRARADLTGSRCVTASAGYARGNGTPSELYSRREVIGCRSRQRVFRQDIKKSLYRYWHRNGAAV